MLQPKLFPGGSVFRVGWLDDTNNLIGNSVLVENYAASNMDLDVWQKVTIPISDFELDATVQKLAMRFTGTFDQGYFIDDIELVPAGAGGPYQYRIAAPANTRYHVSKIALVISSSDTGWDSNKFATLTALTNGLLLRQGNIVSNELIWKINSQQNVDLFGQFYPAERVPFGNSRQLTTFQLKPEKSSIIVTDEEVIEFLVRDDFSTLDHMRAYMQYGIENVVVETS